MVKAIWPRYGRSKFGPPPLPGSHRFMRTPIKQKRDFEFADFRGFQEKTAAGFELSGARWPQNRPQIFPANPGSRRELECTKVYCAVYNKEYNVLYCTKVYWGVSNGWRPWGLAGVESTWIFPRLKYGYGEKEKGTRDEREGNEQQHFKALLK